MKSSKPWSAQVIAVLIRCKNDLYNIACDVSQGEGYQKILGRSQQFINTLQVSYFSNLSIYETMSLKIEIESLRTFMSFIK